MGISQKLFSGKYYVYFGTMKKAILSPQRYTGNIFTEVYNKEKYFQGNNTFST